MDIMAMLGGTSTAIGLVKAIKDAEVSLDVATIKAKMAEILSELADVKMAQIALIEENTNLKAENARLLAFEDNIKNLVEINGYKYQTIDGHAFGWPACPTCLVNDKITNFMVQNGKYEDAKCPRCKTEFTPVISFVRAGVTRREEVSRKRADNFDRMQKLGTPPTRY